MLYTSYQVPSSTLQMSMLTYAGPVIFIPVAGFALLRTISVAPGMFGMPRTSNFSS